MDLRTMENAGEFLRELEPALQENEAANGLMYGLALRMLRFPDRIETPPYFSRVNRGETLVAAALMTPPHNLVVMSTGAAKDAEAFALTAHNLREEHWPVPGVIGPNEPALAFVKAWQEVTGEAFSLNMHERLYELRQVIPPPDPGGSMRLAGIADLELAARWVYEFQAEALPDDPNSLEDAYEIAQMKIQDRDFYLWDDDGPVSLAGRSRPTPHGCCIGPVYTPPEYRARGYATALTAALSQQLLDSGKQFVALFTNLANPTSNSIYMKIGYQPICDFDLYLFKK